MEWRVARGSEGLGGGRGWEGRGQGKGMEGWQ